MIMKKALRIHFDGIVQGVGFRPFVFKLANDLEIKGWVKNTGNGLDIHAEGERAEEFYSFLLQGTPPLAVITHQEKWFIDYEGYPDFKIIKSTGADKTDVLISPDIRTCPDCLQEMFSREDRRYLYPFINCTNCGPRYTIIRDRPYDRDKTTMHEFQMCSRCLEEYENQLDRRFHAQPVACEICGPSLSLLDTGGNEININQIVELLEAGAILAVKGLGGFHLVCDAFNDVTVKRLRSLKERGQKPFALMVRSLDIAAGQVYISDKEKDILASPAAPIVLLPRRNCPDSKISQHVAPNLHNLGIMLPYTPAHYLLFAGSIDVLVMTSANLSGQPLIYKNDTALKDLQGIADYFLIHNRDIFHPCDDSVIQIIGDNPTFIRRARGYVPLPVFLKREVSGSIAGLGGEMKNAFCLAAEEKAFMSQYIGDMHGLENYERFKQEYQSYQKVASVFPDRIAYDLHPEYATTKMARELPGMKCTVQHHHAHLVSVMGEYHLNEPMLGIICDGTGYGEDGKIWGFEFLFGNAEGYKRQGHLEYLPLPGGDAGAKKPLRIAYAYLHKLLDQKMFKQTESLWENLSDQERTILEAQLENGFQIYDTSSAGRLFDAVSGLLGICTEVTYEGQAAVELESKAFSWLQEVNHYHGLHGYSAIIGADYTLGYEDKYQQLIAIKTEACQRLKYIKGQVEISGGIKDKPEEQQLKIIDKYNQTVDNISDKHLYYFSLGIDSGALELKAKGLFSAIVSAVLAGRSHSEIAFYFHYSLACAMLEMALVIGLPTKEMVIGGGVFQNRLLTEILLDLAGEIGVKIYYPTKLPSGDGGLALGQVLIADHAFKT